MPAEPIIDKSPTVKTWSLEKLIAQHHPDLLVVELGDNMAGYGVLPALPNSTHYAATGRVADALARLAAVHAERERPWARVQERLEIEDWTVSGREGVS